MIDVKTIEGITQLSVARGKANALDLDLCEALTTALARVAASNARAVVLTGQGRMFSAGVDLPRMIEGGAAYARRFLPVLHRLYETAFFLPKPVVAAINGHAIAGGCVLACCADRRLMARDAGRIGVTEILVGVPFPALALEVMRFAVAPQFFPEALLRGATYLPDAALERGFVDAVVDPTTLIDAAMEEARALAALSPVAFAQTKRQIRQTVRERLQSSGDATEAAVTEIWMREETFASMSEYVARTFRKA